MKTQNKIGLSMLVAAFIALFACCAIDAGFLVAAKVFVTVAAVTLYILAATYLASR